jgi:hypothetical protein
VIPGVETPFAQPRKPWMSEDERMAFFDAVAFGNSSLGSILSPDRD